MGKRKNEPKTVIASVRLTPEEAARLAREAKAKGSTLSDLLRQRIFRRRLWAD